MNYLLDAFIKAMRRAPVKLAPSPSRIANAGRIIIDVTASPAPIKLRAIIIFCRFNRLLLATLNAC